MMQLTSRPRALVPPSPSWTAGPVIGARQAPKTVGPDEDEDELSFQLIDSSRKAFAPSVTVRTELALVLGSLIASSIVSNVDPPLRETAPVCQRTRPKSSKS